LGHVRDENTHSFSQKAWSEEFLVASCRWEENIKIYLKEIGC